MLIVHAAQALRAVPTREIVKSCSSADGCCLRWCIVNQASHTFALNLVDFAHYIASEGGVIGLTRAPRLPGGRLAMVSLPLYPYRFFAELGGLLSYGNDVVDNFRRAASYADRILKGAKSELPVQAPVKFELIINLKTAKALDLDVPLHLQQRADEVIE